MTMGKTHPFVMNFLSPIDDDCELSFVFKMNGEIDPTSIHKEIIVFIVFILGYIYERTNYIFII